MATVFQDAAFLGPRRRLRLLQADLATVQHGCTYFAGYATNTDAGRMWRLFLARLDQVPMAGAKQVADGAVATFERLACGFPEPEDGCSGSCVRLTCPT